MYLEFFGLKENPFSIAPNPAYMYFSDRHKEALAHLLYGLGETGGFVLLTGEVGTGKTTVCRTLLQQMPDNVDLAFVLNPSLDTADLLGTICEEFGVNAGLSLKDRFDAIRDWLLRNHQQGRNAVLLVDEAQHLQPEVLEQLRLLTNLETDQKKLLQIILIGQPELQALLRQPELRQLAQRITARYHLLPLSEDETEHYIQHRMHIGGCQLPVFSAASIVEIYHASGGIPRLINLICDRALLSAFASSDPQVTPLMIREVAQEILGSREEHTAASPSRVVLKPLLLSALVASVLAGAWWFGHQPLQNWLAQQPAEQASADTSTARVRDADDSEPTVQPTPITDADDEPNLPALVVSVDEQQQVHASVDETQASAAANTHPASGSEDVLLPAVAVASGGQDPQQAQIVIEAVEDNLTPVQLQVQRRLEPLVAQSREPNLAMQQLLAVWGYEASLQQANCQSTKWANLFCQQDSGSLFQLRQLNHPAVVEMADMRGQRYYATLIKLSPQPQLLIGSQRLQVSSSWFSRYWTGNFTILWRAPDGYQRAIGPASQGPEIEWLDNALAKALAQNSIGSRQYTVELMQRVRAFQQQHQLTVDGLAGSQTLIQLNLAVDSSQPRLVD